MTQHNINELQQTIRDAQKTIEALQAQVASANQQIQELKTKEQKKWEPQGGTWYVANNGNVKEFASTPGCSDFGVERPTKELAEKAAKQMRRFNRLLAYVHEFAPDYEPDWSSSSHKYYVFYSNVLNHWTYDFTIRYPVTERVYMPKEVAEGLIKKLNSGEVVLD